MTTPPAATSSIRVDPTNPGQFFACCGLLELAARIKPESRGWFENRTFLLGAGPSLPALIRAISNAPLTKLDPEDATASPIMIGGPFNLRLDWWKANDLTASALKVWAGTMESFRIARAMQHAMREDEFLTDALLDVSVVAFDADDPTKKVEPFYFDARRGPNAHSRDVGFAPNDLGMTTTASPAVEFLCFVGLQRCQPVTTEQRRVFDYHLWSTPLDALLLPVAVAGLLPESASAGYRFESWFRTGQRKHKAFLSAQPKPKF